MRQTRRSSSSPCPQVRKLLTFLIGQQSKEEDFANPNNSVKGKPTELQFVNIDVSCLLSPSLLVSSISFYQRRDGCPAQGLMHEEPGTPPQPGMEVLEGIRGKECGRKN